jgi:hypothetical protein
MTTKPLKNAFYDRTRITFHRGNGYTPEGIEKTPFATFTINDMVDRELIDAICALVRDHIHTAHADFCNVKMTTEEWDC